jgi:hypothetical protein
MPELMWMEMPREFPLRIERLKAWTQADGIGTFFIERRQAGT